MRGIAARNAGQGLDGLSLRLQNSSLVPIPPGASSISGPGLYKLDRGTYKALSILNEFGGDTPEADMKLKEEKISAEAKTEALKVFKEIHK